MDFEDLFKQKLHKHGRRGYGYLKDVTPGSRPRHGSNLPGIMPLVSTLLKSKLLWTLLILAVLLMGLVGVVLVMAILPLLTGTLEFVGQNGLKGVVESAMPYAEKLWHGNSNPTP